MNILSIDTVTDVCSVAITYKGETVQRTSSERVGHSNLILALISSLCAEMEVSFSKLDVMGVDIGPGSFTGVRIGIGVIQGLAYGTNLPVIGVSSLETLAASQKGKLVLPALDARMGQIYCGLYDTECGVTELVSPVVCYPDEVPFTIGNRDLFGLGSGWEQYDKEIVGGLKVPTWNKETRFDSNWKSNWYPEARFVNQLAMTRGLTCSTGALNLRASYVRNQVVNSKRT
ncbi:MAG: tRNA (adenosine(37)-N6)-threonylcarbamoyltransferase complex dimerization subunit type 1 TsaB [Gammaproteobacteria bacterium]|nr:tRNA (adenosine(37)-N6)-threonylcarbamoyltransferase complex dimerization subunit type 1 TsaB [Gammaproteobacteria bacterium]